MGMKGTKTFHLKLFNENRSYVKTNINTAKKLQKPLTDVAMLVSNQSTVQRVK